MEHALWLANRQRFDICFIDILLSDGSGYTLARRIRELYVRRRVPALRMVAWSGRAPDPEHADAQAAGFEAFLLKPVECVRLKSLLGLVTEANSPAPGGMH